MANQALAMLLGAIAFELLGTTSLKFASGTARPAWWVLVALGYGGAFYLFSIVIRTMPLGIAYALWAGLGILGTAVIGALLFRQHLTLLNGVGIALILAGAVLVNVGLTGNASR